MLQHSNAPREEPTIKKDERIGSTEVLLMWNLSAAPMVDPEERSMYTLYVRLAKISDSSSM